MTDEQRKAKLLIHRELEYLRSAGKVGRKGLSPAQMAKAKHRAADRRRKLNEAERINGKKKGGKKAS